LPWRPPRLLCALACTEPRLRHNGVSCCYPSRPKSFSLPYPLDMLTLLVAPFLTSTIQSPKNSAPSSWSACTGGVTSSEYASFRPHRCGDNIPDWRYFSPLWYSKFGIRPVRLPSLTWLFLPLFFSKRTVSSAPPEATRLAFFVRRFPWTALAFPSFMVSPTGSLRQGSTASAPSRVWISSIDFLLAGWFPTP